MNTVYVFTHNKWYVLRNHLIDSHNKAYRIQSIEIRYALRMNKFYSSRNGRETNTIK